MHKIVKVFLLTTVALLMVNFSFLTQNTVKADQSTLGINYKAQVQDIGWQNPVEMGQEAGTDGKSLRMETLNINLENPIQGMKLMYQVHVENIGWQDWVSNGQNAGTIGKGLRLEAVRIKIVGVTGYHVQYQVHVQDIGWMPLVSDGDLSGTVGQSKRIEAIRISIVKDNSSISVPQNISLNYSTHVENIGWQNQVNDLNIAGTTGKGLSIEALKVNLSNSLQGMKIEYQSFVENVGWQDWTDNGQVSGTTGKGLKIEGLRIDLKNVPGYHAQYQVHVQDIGWMPWVNDGDLAGIPGQSKRIEALRIRIVKDQTQNSDQLLFIDQPQNNSNINDNQDLNISGRDLNQYGNKEFDIYSNGMIIGKATMVNQQYNYLIKAGTLSLGSHIITVQAIGNNQTIDEKKISVNINKLQPRMCIDAPIANTVISDSVNIKGWAIDSFGMAYIKIFVDGNYISNAQIGLARNDVDSAYPGYINGTNSGYSYTLDTSKLNIGSHCIKVQAIGNDNIVNEVSVIILKGNNGTMQVSSQLVGFTANYEGYSAIPYGDVGGNSTIGYGHLIVSGETYKYLNADQALALLNQDLQVHVTSVNNFTTGVNISQQQFDSLVDFAFNCGDSALMGSTLLREIKAGATPEKIKIDFQMWVNCNGVPYTGLYRRRTDEWEIYEYGDYTRNNISAPAGYK